MPNAVTMWMSLCISHEKNAIQLNNNTIDARCHRTSIPSHVRHSNKFGAATPNVTSRLYAERATVYPQSTNWSARAGQLPWISGRPLKAISLTTNSNHRVARSNIPGLKANRKRSFYGPGKLFYTPPGMASLPLQPEEFTARRTRGMRCCCASSFVVAVVVVVVAYLACHKRTGSSSNGVPRSFRHVVISPGYSSFTGIP